MFSLCRASQQSLEFQRKHALRKIPISLRGATIQRDILHGGADKLQKLQPLDFKLSLENTNGKYINANVMAKSNMDFT